MPGDMADFNGVSSYDEHDPWIGFLVLGYIVKMKEGLGKGLLGNGKRKKGTIYNFYVISIYSTMIGYNVAFLFCIL